MSDIFSFIVYFEPNPPETFILLVRPFIERVQSLATMYGKDVSVSFRESPTSYEHTVIVEYQGAVTKSEANAFVNVIFSGLNEANRKYIKKL